MQYIRNLLMKAAKECDMEIIRYIEIRFPTLFSTANNAGLRPYEEYLEQGGQDHRVYLSLMPAYEPAWSIPAWYGKPHAYLNAKW
jgi:hypothetical protein